MSDDAHESETATAHLQDAGEGPSNIHDPPLTDNGQHSTSEANDRRKRSQERLLEQLRKRAELVLHIVTNLDLLIWANLAAMYYMDNSTLLLLTRLIPQYAYLTPKPAGFPVPPIHHAAMFLVLSNIACLGLHIFASLPRGTESNRGYLHGSLIMDFIGQTGWTWKIGLLGYDLFIALLMTSCFVAKMEKERIKELIKSSQDGNASRAITMPGQDHDAEERGVVRGISEDVTGDIEMQEIGSGQAADIEEEIGLLNTNEAGQEEGGVLDMFYTGNIIVADFHVLDTFRTALAQRKNGVAGDSTAATALQGVGYTTAYSWTRLQQRLNRFR